MLAGGDGLLLMFSWGRMLRGGITALANYGYLVLLSIRTMQITYVSFSVLCIYNVTLARRKCHAAAEQRERKRRRRAAVRSETEQVILSVWSVEC